MGADISTMEQFKDEIFGMTVPFIIPQLDSELKWLEGAPEYPFVSHVLPAVSSGTSKDIIEAYKQYYRDDRKALIDHYLEQNILNNDELKAQYFNHLMKSLMEYSRPKDTPTRRQRIKRERRSKRLATEYSQLREQERNESSPSLRQEERRNEPSPSLRQEDRRNEASPSLRQEDRRNEPSPSLRQEERRNEASPSLRQEERRNEPSPSIRQEERRNEASPSLRQEDRRNEPSPSIRQEERRNETSPSIRLAEPSENQGHYRIKGHGRLLKRSKELDDNIARERKMTRQPNDTDTDEESPDISCQLK